MKTLLVIICSHEFSETWIDNIKILNDYMNLHDIKVDYCGISNQDDFHHYENIIQFKYKIINTKRQFCKICDFITDYKSELNYDWYMKIRPDIKLLENINFDNILENSINARARVYNGPKKIKYGMSVNGKGIWQNVGACSYSDVEYDIILDDMFFIFDKNIIHTNSFNKIHDWGQGGEEWKQTSVYNCYNINLNVIGIHLENTKYNTFSGDINL